MTTTPPADLRQQPGVCPESKGAGSMFEGSSGLDAKVCRACNGTGQQPAQPESDPMHSLIAEGREYAEHLVAEGIGGHSIVSELTHEVSRLQSALTAAQREAGVWEREYRIEHGRVEHLTADVIAKDKRIAELETENRQLRAEVYE